METKKVLSGYAIVIADRGFVWVGQIEHDGEWCVVRDARCIRVWGTTKGIGQLALDGPTSKTTLDNAGCVRIPARAVIGIIDTEAAKWQK